MHRMSQASRWDASFVMTVAIATSIVFGSWRQAEALVLNEIMFHSEELDDKPHEWIELFNERLDPFDLSGFSICNGVSYVVPEGTWLEGYEYIIIASDPGAFAAKYDTSGMTVIGGWTGSLANNGERVEICNPGGVTVINVRYNDRGKWPVAADGTGHSLSLASPYSDSADADNWLSSVDPSGTPGDWNGHTQLVSGGPPPANGMDASGFITGWLVLGPYQTWRCRSGDAVLQADWLRGTSGGSPVFQTDEIWEEGQVVNTSYAQAQSSGLHPNAGFPTPRVELYEGFSDTINLNDAVYPSDPNNVMSYSFVYVDNVTGSNLAVTLACHSDDAISIMLNGVTRLTSDACRGVGGSGQIADRSSATLRPGKNVIAVKVFEDGGGWSFRFRIEGRGTNSPLTSDSQIQVMTDVDLGMNFDGTGTPLRDPDGDPGDPGDPGDLPGAAPVVINEGFFNTAGDRWIELYNRTGSAVDLSGYYLTDDASDLTKSELAGGTIIPAKGFLTFTDVDLGLDFALTQVRNRIFVALVTPDGETVMDAFNFENSLAEFSEARIPDGDRELDEGAEPTLGAANQIIANSDIVINEIMYNPIQGGSEREWIELYNRGDSAVDMTGWKIDSGLEFDFPNGLMMAAGAFLVVANDPDLIQSIYSLGTAEVIGPAQDEVSLDAFGGLKNRGERVTIKDEIGRTVDTVRYHDGGEWPRWADGHGSSLELIDPLQDNRIGAAWDASDDAHKAEVKEFAYIGRHGGEESELHVFLNSRGVAVVDDLIVQNGGLISEEQGIVDRDEAWRYFKGTEEPPVGWAQLGFNDATWLEGAATIGYGEAGIATELADMEDSYLSVYLRKTFEVSSLATINDLIISVIIDDGFVAYLNGVEVASRNMTRGRTFDQGASGSAESVDFTFDITSFAHLLIEGTNVLAVQGHNVSLGSSDFIVNPRLFSRKLTPGGGGTQHLRNGNFDTNTTYWMIEGNHVRSGRTSVDPITGGGSLKLIATGRGDNKVNRLETINTGVSPNFPTGTDLLIAFKARWVIGSETLVTHGYKQAMAKSHRLAVPNDLGTPGRINSVTQRLVDLNGGNLGPVMTDLLQDPPVPEANEAVTIRIRVSDSDGLDFVRLRHSTGSASTNPSTVTMSSIGGDWYEGEIPGRALNTNVVFHVESRDTTGVWGRYPIDIEERTHPLVLNPTNAPLNDQKFIVYRHEDRDPSTPYQNYRFFMSSSHESLLSSRKLHSNDLIPGSFVFGGDTIYHESKARFSGSPWARGGWGGSWRVSMPRGNELHGEYRKFNMENHGTDARERISHYLIRQMNGGGEKVPYADLQILVRWQVNDRTTNVREHVWAPDSQFIGLWWDGDDDGDLYEMDDRFFFNDGGTRAGSTDGTVRYPPSSPRSDGNGENQENYRFFFGRRNHNSDDDYSTLIDFCQLMDPSTSANTFDRDVWDMVNVEEMLRLLAVRQNTDDWDTWGTNRGKNCYFYRPAEDGRWNLMAWDMELTYGNTGNFAIPTNPDSQVDTNGKFPEVDRMLNRPAIKRMYYAILDEMVNGSSAFFGSSYLTPYMNRLQQIGMGRTEIGRSGGFIDTRANLIRTRISSVVYPSIRFNISTNSGNDFEVDELTVTLSGTAPVEVNQIIVVNNGDEGTAYPVTFSSIRNWRIDDIVLTSGSNELSLFGFDLQGNFTDDDDIIVTSTVVTGPPPVIDLVSPSQAFPGEIVEITGSGFEAGATVFFGATPSPSVSFNSPTSLNAEVPIGSGTVEVTTKNVTSGLSDPQSFDYPPPPVIASIDPGVAFPGDMINISGSGFRAPLRVFFGAVESPSVQYTDEFSISAEVPAGTGSVDITVQHSTGVPSNAVTFDYPPTFVRADVNTDGIVDLSDPIKILLFLFSGAAISCEEAADANDDGDVNVTDSIFLLDYLFRDGAGIPAPYPSAGLDLDGDDINCDA